MRRTSATTGLMVDAYRVIQETLYVGFEIGSPHKDPSGSSTILVWRHPWPPDTITALISDENPEGTLEKSDLEIAVLVLHETTLLDACPESKMAAPR